MGWQTMSKNVRDILSRFSAAWPSGRKDFRNAGDESWKSYALSLRELVESGDRESIAVGLSDENRQVRALCARALGFLPSADTISALSDILTGDTWATARLLAADSLGMIGSDTAHVALEGAQADEEDDDVLLHIEIARSRSSGLEPRAVNELMTIEAHLLDSAHVGEQAPGFILNDGYGTEVALSDSRSKRAVALYFLYGDG